MNRILALAALATTTLVGCDAQTGSGGETRFVLTSAPPAAPLASASEGDDPAADLPELQVEARVHGRVVAGVPAFLDARASEAADADYRWTCSDGTIAEGALTTATFAEAGPVSCTAFAADDSGQTGATVIDFEVRDTPAKWTLMVFINGDSDLETAALDDLAEMEMAGSSEDVQVVVQMDRARGYTADEGDWTTARRFLVGDDLAQAIDTPELEDLGEVDSGDWTTLVDFVDWSVTHFPAERYGFVIWNHGEGWKGAEAVEGTGSKAISYDYESGNALSIAGGDLESFLVETTGLLGGPLDLLGADACLMQTFEVAWTAAPYADVYVASQELEGWDGWSYDTFLPDLMANPDMSAAELGERIATRFQESKDRTQSVIDLAQMDALADALDLLAETLMDSPEGAAQVLDAAEGAWRSAANKDNRDLGHLLEALAESSEDPAVLAAVADADNAFQAAVLTNRTYNYREAIAPDGLSIYVPELKEVDPLYAKAAWSSELLWDDMLAQAVSE